MTDKQKMLEALQRMPDDVSYHRAIDELYLIGKIDEGLHELDAGEGIPHDEVEREFLGDK